MNKINILWASLGILFPVLSAISSSSAHGLCAFYYVIIVLVVITNWSVAFSSQLCIIIYVVFSSFLAGSAIIHCCSDNVFDYAILFQICMLFLGIHFVFHCLSNFFFFLQTRTKCLSSVEDSLCSCTHVIVILFYLILRGLALTGGGYNRWCIILGLVRPQHFEKLWPLILWSLMWRRSNIWMSFWVLKNLHCWLWWIYY